MRSSFIFYATRTYLDKANDDIRRPWLVKHQLWINWRTRTTSIFTHDTGKDVLLREANVTDAVSNTVKGTFTVIHTSPRTNQLNSSGVLNRELIVCQVSEEPAQSQGPSAFVRNRFAATATIPNPNSRNVVCGE